MPDRLADIESRLAAVERRLAALETAPAGADDPPLVEPTFGGSLLTDASAHAGRVLLIFGGAYLLRAITDHEFVPTAIGILMGASYALAWLFIAYRNAVVPERRAIAAFYAATSVLLTLPLLVEAISKFELLSGRQGVLALSAYTALALPVAIRRNLRTLAWLVVLGGIATGIAITAVAHVAIPVAAYLLLLGIASLWTVYRQDWLGLQWFGAAGADAGAVAAVVFASSDQWQVAPRTATLLAALLLLAYLASFVLRTHRQGRQVGPFEPLQSLLAIAVVSWSALATAQPGGQTTMGILAVLLGAAAYALAFAPATRRERGRNFYFYGSLGLLLVVAGTALVMPAGAAAGLWSAMALGMAWLSGRNARVSLSLQCTLLLVAAGAASGLLADGWNALAGAPGEAWPAPVPAHLGIALATVGCLFVPVAQRSAHWGAAARIPQLVVLALSVWEVGGLFLLYAAPMLAGAAGAEPDPGMLAALRTAVLSVAAVTLALSSGHRRWPEAHWLVYPVLILVGVKVFLEDFPNGRPETLFLALAFFGGALLLVARLYGRGRSAVGAHSGSPRKASEAEG